MLKKFFTKFSFKKKLLYSKEFKLINSRTYDTLLSDKIKGRKIYCTLKCGDEWTS